MMEMRTDCLVEHFVPKRRGEEGLGKIKGMHKRVELAAHWEGQWWMQNCKLHTAHCAHLKLRTAQCTLHAPHFTYHQWTHTTHCAQRIFRPLVDAHLHSVQL